MTNEDKIIELTDEFENNPLIKKYNELRKALQDAYANMNCTGIMAVKTNCVDINDIEDSQRRWTKSQQELQDFLNTEYKENKELARMKRNLKRVQEELNRLEDIKVRLLEIEKECK